MDQVFLEETECLIAQRLPSAQYVTGAILLPMAVQMASMPLVAGGNASIGQSTVIVFLLAASLLASALACLQRLSQSSVWAADPPCPEPRLEVTCGVLVVNISSVLGECFEG